MPRVSETQPVILAYLRKKPHAAIGDIVQATDIPRGTVVSALLAMTKRGQVTFSRAGTHPNAARRWSVVK